MNPLEKAAATSPWASVSVGEKTLLLIGLLLLAVALPPWPSLLLIAVCLAIIAVVAKVPLTLLSLLVIAPATFLIPGSIPLMVTITRHGLHWVDGGVKDAATVWCRCVVGMSATMIFALTTPMNKQLAFFTRLGIPDYIVQITMLTYRMIGTLIDTARTMFAAQAQRLGHTSFRRWLRSAAMQAASLFVISFARARALQEGLELRADLSAIVTGNRLYSDTPARPAHLISIACLLAAITALSLSGWLPPLL